MRVLEIFKEIVKIPNCSENTIKLKEYIKQFSLKFAKVEEDRAGNILVTVGTPTVCLQSHYDMVCIDTDGCVEIIEKDNIIKGNNSSLGADNGIGVAMMLSLIEEKTNGEYLFTNDEEIGLIGANALELQVRSKKILNLDEERENIICIGCAGGFDAHFIADLKSVPIDEQDFYQISIDNLPGGHSGIEIHKTIPNALKQLIYYVKSFSVSFVSVLSGDRHNSIPRSGKIIVGVEKGFKLPHNPIFKVKKVDCIDKTFNIEAIDLLMLLPHGVLGWLDEYKMPSKSTNLAIVKTEGNKLNIVLSYRAMTNSLLKELKSEVQSLGKLLNLNLEIKTSYSAWEPIKSNFAEEIQKKYGKQSKIEVIHAGLEGAVLKEKFPNADIVSIGPNIFHPHTSNEYVEKDSIIRVFNIIKKITPQTIPLAH